MRWLAAVPIVLLAGCFDATNAPSCTISCGTDSECPDGQVCNTSSGTCTAGEDCANPQTCTPGEFVACVNGAARTCNANGDGTEDATCGAPGCNVEAKRCNMCVPDEVSCSAAGDQVSTCAPDGSGTTVTDTCVAQCVAGTSAVAAHCRYLEPKWLPDICDTAATMDLFMPNASATFSSDLDTNCTGGVVNQTSGRAICVVRYKTITIPQSVTLTISGQRPIAFVADDALTLSGTIDAGATTSTSGPGGGTATSGTAPSSQIGGGGAGFAQTGGAGGDTASGNGGAGGAILDPLTLAYFAGGPRGGSSGGMTMLGIPGGGGGGGVLFAACRGSATLSTGSLIDVRGGGGGPQFDQILGAQVSISGCAAGGGAGGYVVVEGLTAVSMSGSIFANGGGGGGGDTANDSNGGAGGDGPRSISAGGSGSPGNGGGTGGGGGFRGTNPGPGGGTTSGTNGGGGGGSVGVVHVFTPTGVTATITNTTMSPIPSTRTTPTR